VLGARRGQAIGGPSALAAVVLDNDTAEVLAWVGSPDAAHAADLGANDGVVALRQPGSALKPFVYALAMEELGVTAATLLEDHPLEIDTAGGAYRPRNYDRRFHGAVSARTALGSSLNVPAVSLVARLGPERLLEKLRAFGIGSLTGPGARYGEALALGDGEVRLLELAGAYSALARGGEYLPPRLVGEVRLASGDRRPAPERADPVRVVDPRVAALVTDVLSDDRARAGGFGRDSVLALPFPAAVKTGTSKGHRDNLAVGFTREVTVAVWAGNFDGRPMAGSTGVTGAAPLLREILIAAMRGRSPRPLVAPGLLSEAPVCPHTGHRAGPRCPEHVTERFVPGTEPAICDHPAHASAEGGGTREARPPG
ncbi:MAG: penicillin-binding protein 1C, partial [Deltaproteobacteria bacterium]|nr:penicillin-binding protein 1C [Deltaproteobacteria bacterium]